MQKIEIFTGAKWAEVEWAGDAIVYSASGEAVRNGLQSARITDTSALPVPVVHSAGNFVASNEALSVAWPAHEAGDMGLLLTVTRSDQNDSTAYSGWNDLNVPNVAGSGYREIRALWRKATNDHQADVAMDDSGVMNGACIVNIRGASNVRLIAEAYGSGDGDKVSFASGETIDDNSLVLIAVALGGDTDMSQLVGFANEGLTDIVTHVAAHSAAASGLGLYVCTGTREFAGRLLKTVMTTLAPSAAFRAAVFAFEP